MCSGEMYRAKKEATLYANLILGTKSDSNLAINRSRLLTKLNVRSAKSKQRG